MKIKIYFLLLLIQTIFINEVLAGEKVEKKIEPFENSTNLSLGISNFMFKGGVSRDLNKYFEIGLNFYVGSLYYNKIYEEPTYSGFVKNATRGSSLEFEVKNYLYKEDPVKNDISINYLKAFVGTSMINRWKYNSNIDGEISNCYFGAGWGSLNYNGYNFGIDFGVNIDSSYNSIAFIFFPRLEIAGRF